jgi:hypothetical protein
MSSLGNFKLKWIPDQNSNVHQYNVQIWTREISKAGAHMLGQFPKMEIC